MMEKVKHLTFGYVVMEEKESNIPSVEGLRRYMIANGFDQQLINDMEREGFSAMLEIEVGISRTCNAFAQVRRGALPEDGGWRSRGISLRD